MYKIILPIVALLLLSCGKKEEPAQVEPIKTTQEDPNAAYAPRFGSITKGLNEEKLWERYKAARADAKEQIALSNLNESIDALLLAAECAVALERHDIAAWQFNNAAKSSIDLFKKITDYEKRESMAREMKRGETKNAYIEETRQIFKKDKTLLIAALQYLKEAKKHDDLVLRNDEKRKERKEREEAIEGNFAFIKSTLFFATSGE